MITKPAISQSKLSVEGKIYGLSIDSVIIKDLENKIIFRGYMSGGKFQLGPKTIEPGLFTLNIGKFTQSVFLNNTHVSVSGYVDPSSFEGEDIEITETNLDKRLKNITQKIEYAKNKYSEDVISNLKKAQSAEEQSQWVDKYDLKDIYLTNFVKDIIQNEECHELAAYLAYLYRGPFYENAKSLYDALSDKGKNSLSGKLLAREMDNMLSLANGQPAPDFCIKSTENKDICLNDLKDKILVIDFWASWCGPCRNELKHLKELYKKYKNNGVEFVSISMDDSKDKWEKALEEEKIPWINLWDSVGFKKSKLKELYGFKQIPFIMVIDKDGNIADKKLRRGRLENKLKELTNHTDTKD